MTDVFCFLLKRFEIEKKTKKTSKLFFQPDLCVILTLSVTHSIASSKDLFIEVLASSKGTLVKRRVYYTIDLTVIVAVQPQTLLYWIEPVMICHSILKKLFILKKFNQH